MHALQLTKTTFAMVCCALLPLSSCEEDGPSQVIRSAAPAAGGETGSESALPPPELPPSTGSNPPDMPVLSCGGLLGDSTCDPVTAWPCDVVGGETCGYSNLAGAFRCYKFLTSIPFCGLCDREALFCGAGTGCGTNHCERYCCQDSDCERTPCIRGIHAGRDLDVVGYCPEDSYAACGSDLGDVMHPAATEPDAGMSVDAARD